MIMTPSGRAAGLLARSHALTPTTPVGRALRLLTVALLLGLTATLSPWTSSSAQASSPVLAGARPTFASYDDGAALTVGMRFTTKTAGSVTGVRFLKGPGNTGTHTGALYTADGALLAKATYGSESWSGWQSATFDRPVSVQAGANLIAATYLPTGHYALSNPYSWPDETDELIGTSGAYAYGEGLQFPGSVYQRSNYFVDVAFEAGASAGTQPAPQAVPAPQPSASQTQPAPQPAAPSTGFPSSSSTGVRPGTSLGAYDGPSIITKDGTVIDSKKVTGCLTIKADDVTIKNSLLQSGDCFFNVLSDNGNRGLTMTDVEIDGRNNTSGDAAVAGDGYTCLRCDVHGTVDGFKAGDGVAVRDSFIHDLAMSGGSHNDGIQSLGTTDLKIVHNTIISPYGSTSAIILSTGSASQMRNVTIDSNLLGGGAYTVYAGYQAGADDRSKVGNISVTNNSFTTVVFPRSGAFGPLASTDDPVVVSGNTWYDGPNAGKQVS